MTGLSGMKEIASYCKRSESTILKWIRELNFPAVKVRGGTWESDSTEIDVWRRSLINGGPVAPVKQKPAPRKRRPARKKKAAPVK